jgi:hypothetical protein
MDTYTNVVQTIAIALGASWASGLNLYATIAALGIMGSQGGIQLPPNLEILTNPLVITVAVIMFIVEFFADKIPGFDSVWDGIHTFIRIPAGAILAAQAIGPVHPALQVAAGLVGGTIAGATHATKAGTRLLINTSPEPFSNWIASLSEDILVIAGMWTVLHHPIVFLFFLVAFLVFIAWLLPKVWRGIKGIFCWISSGFKGRPAQAVPGSPPPQS